MNKGQSTIFWVTPQETRKTRVDVFQELWCAPCLKKIRQEPCGKVMVDFLACYEYDFKKNESIDISLLDVCGEELIQKDKCIANNLDYYQHHYKS